MATRTELEARINEVDKGLKEHQKLLKQKEISLSHAQDVMEETRIDHEWHQKNMRYMVLKAEVVDLKEFAAVKELLRTSKEAHVEAKIKVGKLITWVNTYRIQVEGALKELAAAKVVLESYGTLLQFPKRAA